MAKKIYLSIEAIMDWSECYYEGDTPIQRLGEVKLHSSAAEAQKYVDDKNKVTFYPKHFFVEKEIE